MDNHAEAPDWSREKRKAERLSLAEESPSKEKEEKDQLPKRLCASSPTTTNIGNKPNSTPDQDTTAAALVISMMPPKDAGKGENPPQKEVAQLVKPDLQQKPQTSAQEDLSPTRLHHDSKAALKIEQPQPEECSETQLKIDHSQIKEGVAPQEGKEERTTLPTSSMRKEGKMPPPAASQGEPETELPAVTQEEVDVESGSQEVQLPEPEAVGKDQPREENKDEAQLLMQEIQEAVVKIELPVEGTPAESPATTFPETATGTADSSLERLLMAATDEMSESWVSKFIIDAGLAAAQSVGEYLNRAQSTFEQISTQGHWPLGEGELWVKAQQVDDSHGRIPGTSSPDGWRPDLFFWVPELLPATLTAMPANSMPLCPECGCRDQTKVEGTTWRTCGVAEKGVCVTKGGRDEGAVDGKKLAVSGSVVVLARIYRCGACVKVGASSRFEGHDPTVTRLLPRKAQELLPPVFFRTAAPPVIPARSAFADRHLCGPHPLDDEDGLNVDVAVDDGEAYSGAAASLHETPTKLVPAGTAANFVAEDSEIPSPISSKDRHLPQNQLPKVRAQRQYTPLGAEGPPIVHCSSDEGDPPVPTASVSLDVQHPPPDYLENAVAAVHALPPPQHSAVSLLPPSPGLSPLGPGPVLSKPSGGLKRRLPGSFLGRPPPPPLYPEQQPPLNRKELYPKDLQDMPSPKFTPSTPGSGPNGMGGRTLYKMLKDLQLQRCRDVHDYTEALRRRMLPATDATSNWPLGADLWLRASTVFGPNSKFPDVFFWIPEYLPEIMTLIPQGECLPCPICRNAYQVGVKEVVGRMVKVGDVEFFMFTRVYNCKTCKKNGMTYNFRGWNPDVIQLLPPYVQKLFPQGVTMQRRGSLHGSSSKLYQPMSLERGLAPYGEHGHGHGGSSSSLAYGGHHRRRSSSTSAVWDPWDTELSLCANVQLYLATARTKIMTNVKLHGWPPEQDLWLRSKMAGMPDIFFWVLDLMPSSMTGIPPGHLVDCPVCDSDAGVKVKSFKWRKANAGSATFYILSNEYVCQICKDHDRSFHIRGWNPVVLKRLPALLQQKFHEAMAGGSKSPSTLAPAPSYPPPARGCRRKMPASGFYPSGPSRLPSSGGVGGPGPPGTRSGLAPPLPLPASATTNSPPWAVGLAGLANLSPLPAPSSLISSPAGTPSSAGPSPLPADVLKPPGHQEASLWRQLDEVVNVAGEDLLTYLRLRLSKGGHYTIPDYLKLIRNCVVRNAEVHHRWPLHPNDIWLRSSTIFSGFDKEVADPFYSSCYPDVLIWVPEIFPPTVFPERPANFIMSCPVCRIPQGVSVKSSKWRNIQNDDRPNFYIYTRTYICSRCKEAGRNWHFQGYTPDAVKLLPKHLQKRLPCIDEITLLQPSTNSARATSSSRPGGGIGGVGSVQQHSAPHREGKLRTRMLPSSPAVAGYGLSQRSSSINMPTPLARTLPPSDYLHGPSYDSSPYSPPPLYAVAELPPQDYHGDAQDIVQV